MGRTLDRAVAQRWPLEELWLRTGYRRDPERYDWGLGSGEASWRGRSWSLEVEGYQLLRETHAVQPGVDPRRGGRGTLATWFSLFEGDLRVRLSGDAEAVGGRASEFGPSGWLEGYVSFGAGATLTLADATVAFRVRNLENERRPQTWMDPATGFEALGPGMEFRMVFAWRLYN
jgi:hypothetical protein